MTDAAPILLLVLGLGAAGIVELVSRADEKEKENRRQKRALKKQTEVIEPDDPKAEMKRIRQAHADNLRAIRQEHLRARQAERAQSARELKHMVERITVARTQQGSSNHAVARIGQLAEHALVTEAVSGMYPDLLQNPDFVADRNRVLESQRLALVTDGDEI